MTLARPARSLAIVEVDLDVGAAVPGAENARIGCTIFAPPEPAQADFAVVAIAGATYSRRYWDLDPPGHFDFSQARYFAERGVIFAAVDYLGAGEPRPADGVVINTLVVADAAHAAFEQLRIGLHAGTLGLPPVEGLRFVGVGQSFGGSTTIVQQATFGDYSAIATLGTSDALNKFRGVEGASLPANWDDLPEGERREIVRAGVSALVGGELPPYLDVPRETMASAFYAPGMDEALLQYDVENVQTVIPRNVALDSLTPGFTTGYAARITTPVFLAFGELEAHDRQAHAQVQKFSRSRDVTLCIFPAMAHMHNFAETRALLWDRLRRWLDTLP